MNLPTAAANADTSIGLGPPKALTVQSPKKWLLGTSELVTVELPLRLQNSEFARHYRVPIARFVLFIVLCIVAFMVYAVAFGKNNANLGIKVAWIFCLIVGIALHIPRLYYYMILDTLSDEICLLVGSNGFTDTRILAQAIDWKDIKSVDIEEVNRGPKIGVWIGLTRPCTFNERYLKRFESEMWSAFKDRDRIFIYMYTLEFERNVLFEIFKAMSKNEAEGGLP